jgi:hypothetical protein
MIKIKTAFTIALIASLALSSAVLAADTKSFRAVGTLTKVTSTDLTIRTSAQDLEVTHDAKTKVTGGELKTGKPATITYIKVSGRPYATDVVIRSSDR